MAYATRHMDFKGPHAYHKGEFYGNELISMLNVEGIRVLSRGATRNSKGELSFEELVLNLRVGKPAICEIGTSSEMIRMGFVGTYLIEDSADPLPPHAILVITDELEEGVVTGECSAKVPFKIPPIA